MYLQNRIKSHRKNGRQCVAAAVPAGVVNKQGQVQTEYRLPYAEQAVAPD